MKGKHRILPLALGFVIALAVLVLGGGTALAEGVEFAGGDGTEGNPWQIKTAEQLATVAEEVYLDKHFVLTDDIDLSAYLSEGGAGYNGGEGWEPIGKWYEHTSPDNAPFTGNFDGGGHKISGLFIYREEANYQGLFGYIDGATIQNVKLEDVDVTGENIVGGLVGNNNSGTIINSNAAGSVTGTFSSVGGLVGSNNSGEITYSYAEVAVQGDYSVGGLVGDNSSGSIVSCYATGTVSDIDIPTPESQGYFGGLVGRNHYDGEITDCYATGNVDGTHYVGGLAGANKKGGVITSSYATGAVTGTDYVGGLVGYNLQDDLFHHDNPVISNCYATGSVEGTQWIGGLVGENSLGIITQSYATGAVIGTDYVGGLVGSSDSSIISSYYDSETTGCETGHGEPKTTIQMQTPITFVDWDFTGVWGINPEQNGGYPFLRWQTKYKDAQFDGGTGEVGAPYQVATPWQLNNARLYLDKHFILVENINLSGYLSSGGGGYNEGKGWEPIGTSENSFIGSFSGDFNAINNLIIDRTGTNYVGLFGYVGENGEIRKLGLVNVDVTGEEYVGGLAGFNYKGTIASSHVTGSVNGSDTIGGLTGQNQGTVTGCYSTVDVTGTQNVGGLAGLNFQSEINNSYAVGPVNGDTYIGGLVGFNYSTGSITNSYAAGVVDGSSWVGGLGVNDNGTINSSFWDTQTSGQSDFSGSTGKTTAEMKQLATFTSWNFDDTWKIDTGTYPYLEWQEDYKDFAPPVFAEGYPIAEGITHNALNLLVQVDESSTAYYVVLPDEEDEPKAAQVKAGTNSGDDMLAENLKGSIGLTADSKGTVSITGLNPETAYDIYVTAEDSAGNLQPDISVVKVDVSTTETPPDNNPPVAGGGGAISIFSITHNSLNLSWEAATDDVTGQENLQYKVVFAEENNIGTAFEAEEYGTTVKGWTANLTSTEVSGLSADTTYYFNIIVRDQAGNMEVYDTTSQTTKSEPSGGGSGGGGTRSTTDYSAKVTGGGAPGTKISIDVNTRSGIAVVSLGKLAEDVLGGEEIPVITVPPIEGVDTYTIELPGTHLCSSSAGDILTFSAEIGSITIPGNMLTGTGLESKRDIGITIGEGDKSSLPVHVRETIGDRPIIQLTLTVEGEKKNWSNPEAPVTVSIPYKPTQEELADPEHIVVWYLDGEGNAVEVPNGRYDPVTGAVTFATTHFSRYAVVYVHKTFDDLGSVEWGRQQIEVLASKGIVRGINERGYFPSVNITRADFLYSLVRALGVDATPDGNFDDIEDNAYYYKEIGIARKLCITSGTGDNRFCPNDSITRQDMITLTVRAMDMLGMIKEQGLASELDSFADKPLIADYALEGIATAVKEGLIIGSGDRINPLGNTTRAEAAVFLYRIYNKY
jgi:hypothetical protein